MWHPIPLRQIDLRSASVVCLEGRKNRQRQNFGPKDGRKSIRRKGAQAPFGINMIFYTYLQVLLETTITFWAVIMTTLDENEKETVKSLAEFVESLEQKGSLESEITSSLVGILSEESFNIQQIFGTLGYNGRSFETSINSTRIRYVLTVCTDKCTKDETKWKKISGVPSNADFIYKSIGDIWYHCKYHGLMVNKKTIKINPLIRRLLLRVSEGSIKQDMARNAIEKDVIDKTELNDLLQTLKFPVYFTKDELSQLNTSAPLDVN